MIYQISSGQGPAECELGVAKLLDYLRNQVDLSLIDTSPGYYADTFRSAPATNAKTGSLIFAPVRQ